MPVRVEDHVERGPMRGEYCNRIFPACAARSLLAITAILRGVHELQHIHRPVAVGPAEVVPLVHVQQRLSRVLAPVQLRRKYFRPVLSELVASVSHGVELPVAAEVHPGRIPRARRIARSRTESLVHSIRIELPYSRPPLELGAWIVSR